MADASRRSTRFSMRSKQLGQLLLENGDVTAEQVAQALKIQEEQGGMLGVVLREQGFCADGAVAAALLKQVQVTDVQCSELLVSPEVAQLVGREICENEKLCPFERIGNLLCVVMGNPLNRRAITQIEERSHLKVKSFKSVWPKINELIQRTYSEEGLAEPEAQPEAAEAAPVMEDAQPPMEIAAPEPVIQLQPAAEAEPEVEAPAARRQAAPAPEAKIEGIDNLNEATAEVIETTRRGLAKRPQRSPVAEAAKPKAEKKAKVNVDLDTLDLSQGEVIKDAVDDEGWEEISAAAAQRLQRHGGAIIALKAVKDGYFYTDGKAPVRRTEELDALIEKLPAAAVIAQSIGEYEETQAPPAPAPKPAEKPVLKMAAAAAMISAPAPAAVSGRPVELQAAPAVAMSAVLISENEFQAVVSKLGEDPVGEWDWKYAAPGPVPVLDYEEN